MNILINKTFIHLRWTKILIYPAFILLLYFGLNQKSNAQNEKLRFESIGSEQGLANNVISILQDRKGYIWIGTDDGLNKYDGYSFTKYRFDPFDSNSVSENFIYTIWEDKQGFIWVGTGDGLCRFDRATEKFTRYKPLENALFSDPNICAINEDKNGWLWVGNASGGLCRFNRNTGKFVQENINLDIKSSTTSISADPDGILWIGTTNGLRRLTLKSSNKSAPSPVDTFTFRYDPRDPNSISSNSVGSVFVDRAGIIWAATKDKGLNSFNKKTGVFTRYLHDKANPHSISTDLGFWPWNGIGEDRDGNLWINTAEGLNKLNKERTAFNRYYHKQGDGSGISNPALTALTIDRAGIIWVCTYGGGLNKANLHQKMFGVRQNEPGNSNSLSNNNVTAIYEDSSGVVWIGTEGGGLNRWDKGSNKFSVFKASSANPRSLQSGQVNAMVQDKHGHFWIGNGEMLSLFDEQTGESINYNSNEKKLTNGRRNIFCITIDHEGLIWIGTAGDGLKIFNEEKGKFIRTYNHTPGDTSGISDYGVRAVYADSRDNIWIGFNSKGTDKLDKASGKFIHYRYKSGDPSGISSNSVNCFFEDSGGTLWLGTNAGGLCSFDYSTGKFTTYTNRNGLVDNSVFSILEDNNNKLWMGTANGLSKFDLLTKKFTNYDEKDGLQSNQFFAGEHNLPSCCKGKDGTLYFGGNNGFTFFDPQMIKGNSTIAPVVITQFKLFDSLIKGGNELNKIVLKHDQNYFSFEFSSLSFYSPEKNQYAYKLEGIDKNWIHSGSRHYAGYTDIGPGTYTFKVKATNNDGVWNEEGVSIAVVIRPPWWRTWWAYALYGIVLVIAIIMVDRYLRKKAILKERERARQKELEQAREIEKAYHELKLTQAQLIQSEKMASLGELTAGIAHEIQNPLNFVNNFSDVNAELIEELTQEADKGNIDEIKSIANAIKENEQKIIHHGKRADAIVKGMLQHSRTNTGQKEPTDINLLADEYLRLAYHGLRAKDKSFKANFKTELDPAAGKINIVPQEIGRVILNLINNAFYAVDEKQKLNGNDYEPTVRVSTQKHKGKIEIKVMDNGNGIPQKIIDKIFQPFFTTKPTGQGTGLGLSLSYDIIKSHGGEIKVETKEGEGSSFIIEMPAG